MSVLVNEGQPDIYRGFERVLVVQKRIDKALEVAEQGRAKAFETLLASRLSPEVNPPQALEPPTIDRIKAIAKRENSTLVQYSLLYDYDRFNQNHWVRVSFNQLYAYAIALFIWVVTAKGQVTFRQVDLEALWYKENTSLAGVVRHARESIVSKGNDRAQANAHQQLQILYQLLIEPIADLLPRDPSDRVTMIPQDFLFLVPFPALIDQNGKYLIEKHTLLSAPAIHALELTRNGGKRSGDRFAIAEKPLNLCESLVVGNPKMPSIYPAFGEPGVQLPSLPDTEQEAKAIAQFLNTEPLIGDRATKAKVVQQMSRASIVHLATHGLLDNNEGFRCAIALAPSDKDDGLLNVREIFNLHLNAQLVVLSGCDTTRGRIWGDGVFVLSRAFIAAGVPSIVMSLWLPPSASTTHLELEFYQNLQHHEDKAQALRNAMLTTMQEYPNPRDWASFILIGKAD